MCRRLTGALVFWTVAILASPLAFADAPRAKELRTQTIGNTTYFYVHFKSPDGLDLPYRFVCEHAQRDNFPPQARGYLSARVPRLIACDGKKSQTAYRLPQPPWWDHSPRLEFVGKVVTPGKAEFLLLYPTLQDAKEGDT